MRKSKLTTKEFFIGVGELALGIGMWMTSGGLPIPHPVPVIYWIGIALMVVGALTILYALLFKNIKPKIKIWPETFNQQAKIVIQNIGEEKAEFEAKLSFISTNDKVNLWKYPKDIYYKWEGKTKRLLIATFEHLAYTASVSLKFYPSAEDGQPFEVAKFMPGCQPPMPIPEIIFSVTITSFPKAINSPYTKTFRINPIGVFEEIKSRIVK